MILRRLSQSLKQQNWMAIWVEFLIVVVGIFVGVQVNGWWTSQSDAHREIAYLEGLQRDFAAITAELEGDADKYRKIAASMKLLLDQSRKESPDVSVAELNAAASALITMEGTTIVNGTYLNLTGSGDLAIIRNKNITNEIAAFYGFAEVIRLVGNTHESQLVNIFQPYIVENLDYTGMLKEQHGISPPSAFTPDRIVAALKTPEFRNIAAVKWDIATDSRGTVLKALDDARKIQALIDAELEKKK